MSVFAVTDDELRELIFDHDQVIVLYNSQNCPYCKVLAPLYINLSNSEKYKEILFLTISAEQNPVAFKIVGKTGKSFACIYNKGFLIECGEIQNEKMLIGFLEKIRNKYFKNINV